MKKTILALTLFVYFSCSLFAQETFKNPKRPLTFEASYIGDNVNNLSGGIKTGSCYLGMANILLNFDFEKAGLWKGGQFYINAANTHGVSPSFELLGDVQVASNIDAGNHTYLQEVWFKQALGKVELTLGLQDLNVEFANSANGALYMNSSFGILPVISGNITPPIFPLTALGLTAKWNISENAIWVNALYDGSPTDFDYNPYNVKWQFISGDGLLAISEYQYNATIMELPGTYKIGGYAHSHIIEESLHKNIPDSLNHNIFGLYAYADQKLWQNSNKSIDLFAQLGYSPCTSSTNDFYLGLGVNYSGLFSKEGADILGLAFAHEHFKDGMKSETAVELTYQYQLTNNIFIQPDFQYIINPAGLGITLKNCLAMNFRFGISF
jgi:porin